MKNFFVDYYNNHKKSIPNIVIFISTAALNLILYAIFITAEIEANLSNILSWLLGILFAFVMYKLFVVKDKSYKPSKIVKDFLKFFLSMIVMGIITIAFFYELYARGIDQPIFGINGLSTKIIVTVIELLLNYLDSIQIELPKKTKPII